MAIETERAKGNTYPKPSEIVFLHNPTSMSVIDESQEPPSPIPIRNDHPEIRRLTPAPTPVSKTPSLPIHGRKTPPPATGPITAASKPHSEKGSETSPNPIKRNTWKVALKKVREIKKLLYAISIFVIVTTFTLTSWPLAHLTPTRGFLPLNILAKLTDYSLDGAVESAWENVQWGPLAEGSRPLLSFMAMSWTLSGWCKIIFRGCLTTCKRIVGLPTSQTRAGETHAPLYTTKMGCNPAVHARLISLIRYAKSLRPEMQIDILIR